MPHLWDIPHRFFSRGNWFASGDSAHVHYPSWEHFIEEARGWDKDYVIIVHWDWYQYKTSEWSDCYGEEANPLGMDVLEVRLVNAKRASQCSISVYVNKDQEEVVRQWLEHCAQNIASLWQPFITFQEITS